MQSKPKRKLAEEDRKSVSDPKAKKKKTGEIDLPAKVKNGRSKTKGAHKGPEKTQGKENEVKEAKVANKSNKRNEAKTKKVNAKKTGKKTGSSPAKVQKLKSCSDRTKTGTENATDKSKENEEASKEDSKVVKREARDKQKALKSERKKKKDSSLFELGVKAKQLWETARSQETGKEEKLRLIKDLHASLEGHVLKVIHAHDTVRVVEFLMAEGDDQTRQRLFDELKDDLVSLSKSKYAVFFVQKILSYGTKEQKQTVIKKLEGKVCELTKHKVANGIIETIFNEVANAPQRNALVQEFFGPEFRLWKEPDLRTAVQLVQKHPLKEKTISRSLQEHVNILITKGCYNRSLVHTVFWNYMQLLNHQISTTGSDEKVQKARKARADFVAHLRDVCVHILHSHDGARVSMNALWHGTSKDRKSIMKSFKSFIVKICKEEHGHMVLLAALDCVDDTKLMAKAILGELATGEEALGEVFASAPGRKFLMYLMVGRNRTFFHPDYLALLQQGDGNEFSKKEPEVRRKEMTDAFQDAMFGFLQRLPVDAPLRSDTPGPYGIFLQAVLNSDLVDQAGESVKSVLRQVAKLATSPNSDSGLENSLREDAVMHRLVKKLIAQDGVRAAKFGFSFSSLLLDNMAEHEETAKAMLSFNRGLFVFVSMLETELPHVCDALKGMLNKNSDHRKLIEESSCKGAEVLLKKLSHV